jgi:RND family efflux transporter MFP subunit
MIPRLRASALTLLLGAVAAVAVVLAVTALGTDATAARATERTAVAAKGVVQTTVSGSGNLVPGAEHDLSFDADGTVSKVVVTAGEHVSQGALLAEIDPGSADVALAQAEADLSTAEDALDATTTTSTTTTASLQAKVDAAKLTLQDAKDAVAGTKLYAPVAGTIADVGIAVGDAVTADGTTPAVTLVQLSRYKMTVALGEADIDKVKVGQPATVTVSAAADEELAAKVTAVDPLSTSSATTSSSTTAASSSSSSTSSGSSAVSYSVTLELTQSAKGLKPGMSATAEIVTAQASGVTVPTQAISGSTVTVVKNGVRTVRQVQVGARGDSVTQILSGVTAGESVLVTSASATAGANAASTTSSPAQGSAGAAGALSGAPGGAAAGAGGAGGGPPSGGGAPGGGAR